MSSQSDDEQLAEVSRSHLAAAGWLGAASIALHRAADLRDGSEISLVARIAEVLPASEDGEEEDASQEDADETDRAFLLDRATTHRRVAEGFASNALALLGLASNLPGDSGEGFAMGVKAELGDLLARYVRFVGEAARELAASSSCLNASRLAGDDAWQEPIDRLRAAVRFLEQEAACFDAIEHPVVGD